MIIAWFSCGVTSAVACKIALNLYNDVQLYFISKQVPGIQIMSDLSQIARDGTGGQFIPFAAISILT